MMRRPGHWDRQDSVALAKTPRPGGPMDEPLLGMPTAQNDVRESSVLGMLVISRQGTVVGHNLRFCEVWGIPPSLMQSKNADSILELVLQQIHKPEGFIEQ